MPQQHVKHTTLCYQLMDWRPRGGWLHLASQIIWEIELKPTRASINRQVPAAQPAESDECTNPWLDASDIRWVAGHLGYALSGHVPTLSKLHSHSSVTMKGFEPSRLPP